jgi:hypothetical protein
VKVRAPFNAVDKALFPNQIVNVQLLMKTPHNVVTVPTAAAAHGGVTSTSSTPITGCRSDLSISARLMAQWQRPIPACRPATGCARRHRPLARRRACDHAERHRAKRRQQRCPRRTRRIVSRKIRRRMRNPKASVIRNIGTNSGSKQGMMCMSFKRTLAHRD